MLAQALTDTETMLGLSSLEASVSCFRLFLLFTQKPTTGQAPHNTHRAWALREPWSLVVLTF